MYRGGGGGGVPKGWDGCPTVCADVIGGSFLAFKTPLSAKLNQGVVPYGRFHTKDVFLHAEAKGVALAVWVDLTNTTRYYSKEEVRSGSKGTTKYVKMSMEGHGKKMSPGEVESFARVCEEGILKGGVVGVHCTHGFNRTGFMICAYLMLRKGFSVDQALEEFKEKRPPGIYREEYVEELLKIGGIMERKVVIVVPEWDKKKSGCGRAEYIGPEGFRKNEFPFPEIDVKFEFDLGSVLQKFYKALGDFRIRDVEVSEVQSGSKLDEIKDKSVSWVSRGCGFYLFIEGKDRIFLIGDKEESKYCVWRVRKIAFLEISGGPLFNTLLWGELTKIENPIAGPAIHAFIISDILSIQGDNFIRTANLNTRRSYIRQYIMSPRNSAISKGQIVQKRESFALRTKPYFPMDKLSLMLNPGFNFRLEMPPKKIIFVSQNLTEPVLEWTWPTAIFTVGPIAEDKTGNVQLISNEGTIVTTLPVDQLTAFPTLREGSIIIGEFNGGVWSVEKLLEEGIPDSLFDIQKAESSISKDVLLSLLTATSE